MILKYLVPKIRKTIKWLKLFKAKITNKLNPWKKKNAKIVSNHSVENKMNIEAHLENREGKLD